MSERKEKKIRRLQRRIEELEGENQKLRTLFLDLNKESHWLRKPYSEKSPSQWLDLAAGYSNPMDAHYAPIPSGHKPGIFRRLKAWLFG